VIVTGIVLPRTNPLLVFPKDLRISTKSISSHFDLTKSLSGFNWKTNKTSQVVKCYMNKITKGTKTTDKHDDFINRLNNCKLLGVMDKIYKKEYGMSAKKYLLRIPSRKEAERMVRTLEYAPASITDMFQRRLDCKCSKKKTRHHPVWTPNIPVPAIKKNPEFFIEEGSRTGGFHANFPKDAGAGRLLYITMKPSEFLNYAFAGELVEKRSEDEVGTTELIVKHKQKRILKCKPQDAPFLKLDLIKCQFVYHDGRHRAVAADELGVKEIPVFIEHDVPINEEQTRCLKDRKLWKKESARSPDLRHFGEV